MLIVCTLASIKLIRTKTVYTETVICYTTRVCIAQEPLCHVTQNALLWRYVPSNGAYIYSIYQTAWIFLSTLLLLLFLSVIFSSTPWSCSSPASCSALRPYIVYSLAFLVCAFALGKYYSPHQLKYVYCELWAIFFLFLRLNIYIYI